MGRSTRDEPGDVAARSAFYGFSTVGWSARSPRRCAAGVGAIVTVCVAPLIVAAAASGTLSGDRVHVPLTGDYLTLARFLLAMPLLLVSLPLSDDYLRLAVDDFVGSAIARRDRAAFDRLVARAQRQLDGRWWDLATLGFVVVAAVSTPLTVTPWATTSWSSQGAAALWHHWVALPLFRALVLVWMRRIVIWTWLMWRASKLDLDLRPGHPDHSGGLLCLGEAQQAFVPLALADGILVGASAAERIQQTGAALTGFVHLLLAHALVSATLLAGPLVVWSGHLWRLKRMGLEAYDALGDRIAREFEARWLAHADPNRSLLDVGDVSAVCDFNTVYDGVRSIRIAPIRQRTWLAIGVVAALPVPVALIMTTPLDETFKAMVSVLM